MKLKYYGTSAAEGVPGLFCDCEVCRYSRLHGGKNIRTRSQALIDDSLLIDLPPDTLSHVQNMGLELYKIQHLLITHSHSDHLLATDLYERQESHCHVDGIKPLNIYGSMPTIDLIIKHLQRIKGFPSDRWILSEIVPYMPFSAGDFTVTPYKANHAFNIMPVFYDIQRQNKRMLYAHDTGYFLEEVWQFLKTEKPFFNLVSLDCTACLKESAENMVHMNLTDCIKVKEKLIQNGNADSSTTFVLNHFSHNCLCTYDSLLPIAEKNGFTVSYDGLEITF